MWRDWHEQQKQVCRGHGAAFVEAEPALKVGLATDTIGQQPVYGMRYRPAEGSTGWYIWCGEHSEADDFFDAMCAQHLSEFLPQVIAYLALAPGSSFMIDGKGYEDVWFDPGLAETE